MKISSAGEPTRVNLSRMAIPVGNEWRIKSPSRSTPKQTRWMPFGASRSLFNRMTFAGIKVVDMRVSCYLDRHSLSDPLSIFPWRWGLRICSESLNFEPLRLRGIADWS